MHENMIEYNNSETVSEVVIGRIPAWITSWWLVTICLMIVIGLFISCFVQYQESLNGSIVIIKSDDEQYKAIALMPSLGYGMIESGQSVIISLDAYPERKYGTLRGTVSYLGTKMNNHKYEVGIKIELMELSNGVIPRDLDKQFGNVRVIVDSQPLIFKLIPPLRSIIT